MLAGIYFIQKGTICFMLHDLPYERNTHYFKSGRGHVIGFEDFLFLESEKSEDTQHATQPAEIKKHRRKFNVFAHS